MVDDQQKDDGDDENDDVDPFEELGVGRATGGGMQTTIESSDADDALDALMADNEDAEGEAEESVGDGMVEGLAEGDDQDPLSSLTEDLNEEFTTAVDEPSEEPTTTESDDDEVTDSNEAPDAAEVYTMLLRTVWVDGILDPAEVQLLARKREQLGITFERHLKLVREVVG